MRREEELFIALARINRQVALEKFEQLTKNPFDWPYFLRLCLGHKLSPIICLNLKEFPAPKQVLGELSERQRKTLMDNLVIENEIKRLAKAFNQAGFEPVLVKGFALIEQAYGKKGLRPMEDIDLLVSPEEIEKSEKVLKENGYQLRLASGVKGSYPKRVRESKDLAGSLLHGFNFFNRQKGTKVDLQWTFNPKRHGLSVDSNAWLERAFKNERLGVKMLPPEIQLMYLVLHNVVMHSLDYRLYMALDMALLVENQKIDWERVKELSKEMKAERYVYFAGILANRFYGNVFPGEVLDELRPSALTRKIYGLLADNFFLFGRLPGFVNNYPLAFLRNKVFRTVPFSIPF